MAPFNAKYAAPGYFSLPAIINVLPLLYLLEFFGKEGKSIFFTSLYVTLKIFLSIKDS